MSKRAMDSIHSNTMHLVLIDFEGSWVQVSTCRAESRKNLVTNAMLPGNGEAQTSKLFFSNFDILPFFLCVFTPQTKKSEKQKVFLQLCYKFANVRDQAIKLEYTNI